EPPAIGDVLIDAQSREPLDPSAIVADASAPVLAFPTNPETGNIRGGARNKLFLIRQAEGENGEAPGPILAFSAVCTHQGCDVNVIDDDGMLLCPCHGSKFDPYDKGAVV